MSPGTRSSGESLPAEAVRSPGRDEPARLLGRAVEWPGGGFGDRTAPSREEPSPDCTWETLLAVIYGSGHNPGEEILRLLRNTQDARGERGPVVAGLGSPPGPAEPPVPVPPAPRVPGPDGGEAAPGAPPPPRLPHVGHRGQGREAARSPPGGGGWTPSAPSGKALRPERARGRCASRGAWRGGEG